MTLRVQGQGRSWHTARRRQGATAPRTAQREPRDRIVLRPGGSGEEAADQGLWRDPAGLGAARRSKSWPRVDIWTSGLRKCRARLRVTVARGCSRHAPGGHSPRTPQTAPGSPRRPPRLELRGSGTRCRHRPVRRPPRPRPSRGSPEPPTRALQTPPTALPGPGVPGPSRFRPPPNTLAGSSCGHVLRSTPRGDSKSTPWG